MAREAPKHKIPEGMAGARHKRLVTDRQPFLDRARELSKLTIAYLFPEDGQTGATSLEVPWNSLPAYCVANLGSKLIFSIFPPNTAPMKLSPDQKALEDMRQVQDPQQRADLLSGMMKGLSRVETEFVEAFEQDGDRAKLTVAAMKMIVGGTHGFKFEDDGQVRSLPLENFCCVRDKAGNLIEFTLEDWLAWETVDQPVRDEIERRGYSPTEAFNPMETPESIPVYTWGRLITKPGYPKPVWEIYQEVWTFEVEGSRYCRYPEAMPYLFCPWLLIPGENYGRSYVEMYEADIQTVEGNTQTITQGAAALAKIIGLVKPGGYTDKKALAKAENGDFITGREEDVYYLRADKGGDLQVTDAVTEKAEQRLARAFLLNSSIQRAGERVTAEEIRFVAQELQDALGGVYSQQAVTFQTPFVRMKLQGLQKAKRVTRLPKGTTKLTLTGGVAALSRNTEMNALSEWAAFMQTILGDNWQQVLGPNAAREMAKRAATALHINQDGLIPSEEEAAQMDQQNQMQQMLANPAAIEGIKQVGNNLTSNQVADTNAEAKLGAEVIKAQPSPDAASVPA